MTWACLLDPRFPAGFPCLGERRLNNSACLHLQHLPSPLLHQLLHCLPLNLTVALPRFSPRECSNFAGYKFLPCVVALQLSEYLCTRMVGFPGDFFFYDAKKLLWQGAELQISDYFRDNFHQSYQHKFSCCLPHLLPGPVSAHALMSNTYCQGDRQVSPPADRDV